jgi:geranyl-CoA carboxylase alpha subunit
MIAKIITWGEDREEARQRLVRALARTTLLGLRTNRAFLMQLLEDPVFVAGDATTAHINDALLEQTQTLSVPANTDVAIGLVVLMRAMDPQPDGLRNWSNVAPVKRHKKIDVAEQRVDVAFSAVGDDYTVEIADEVHQISVVSDDGETLVLVQDGVRESLAYAFDGETAWLGTPSRQLSIRDASYEPALSADAAGSGEIVATTEGALVNVAVAVGDRVSAGQLVAVVEAMKMEHRHVADGDGVVTAIGFSQGTQVKKGQLLVSLTLDEEGEAA